MKQKKLPMRMCLACREMKPKKELLRVVKNKENEISVDFKGKKPGRGAYICRNMECFNIAKKEKRLEKEFCTQISEEVYNILKQQMEEENAE